MEHKILRPGVSQFRASGSPALAPDQLAKRVQVILSSVVNHHRPNARHDDFRLRRFDSMKRAVLEGHVVAEIDQLELESEESCQTMRRCQIQRSDVDFPQPQKTSYAI